MKERKSSFVAQLFTLHHSIDYDVHALSRQLLALVAENAANEDALYYLDQVRLCLNPACSRCEGAISRRLLIAQSLM